MTVRKAEEALLRRCVEVIQFGQYPARLAQAQARNQMEANIFHLAALVIQSSHPGESARLMQASERYLSRRAAERLSPLDVVHKGWIPGLPRLRDMLSHKLCGPSAVQAGQQPVRQTLPERTPVASHRIFHTHTALSQSLRALLEQLEQRLLLDKPVDVYLAGGMAVHLYTSARVTTDVDAEFGKRLHLPGDLAVDVVLEDGSRRVLYFDTNYNSSFALMHEDYLNDAVPVDLGTRWLRAHVLSPVDLAVSKIARFAGHDREDIAVLVRHGLTSADEIKQRANSSLAGYVGNLSMLKLNIRDAVALARETEKAIRNEPKEQAHRPCGQKAQKEQAPCRKPPKP